MFYTKLTDQSLQQILEQFDLSPIAEWSILEGGSANTNHILKTAHQKYVLTICESKIFEEAASLVNLLKYLERNDFKTTKVIPNKTGQNVSHFNNKPIILKEYIEGKIIDNHSDILLKKIGQKIAQLHLIPAPDFLPKVEFTGQKTLTKLRNEISHPFVHWLNDMYDYIKQNIKTDLPKTLIHRDVFYNNVVISPQNEPIIFDFEETIYYYRMYDIGMAVIGLCNEEGKINFEKVEQLIQGYEQISILQAEEKKLLKLFTCYAATHIASWRFRQFNIVVPHPILKNRYVEMKNIADEMKAMDY